MVSIFGQAFKLIPHFGVAAGCVSGRSSLFMGVLAVITLEDICKRSVIAIHLADPVVWGTAL